MTRKLKKWTKQEIDFLVANYPTIGKMKCADLLGRNECQIRSMTHILGLKQDKLSAFCRDWKSRSAKSRIGKKRPTQSEVMKNLHATGKLIQTSEQRRLGGVHRSETYAKNGHPRGALGMKHTPETREKMSIASRLIAGKRTPEQKIEIVMRIQKTRVANGTRSKPRGSWKQSWREIGSQKIFCRSSWEANYARFLEWQRSRGDIVNWEHEPMTFWFEGVRRGCVSYLPDFRVTHLDGRIEYHEVKGWMDDRSKTKIKRMAKYHPDVNLVVIDAKSYRKLQQLICKAIPGWE